MNERSQNTQVAKISTEAPADLFESDHKAETSVAQVEQSRAMQEVQAAMIVAKKFPRNERKCWENILRSCSRLSLAENSLYSYPRGGKVVKGINIHLARAMAKAWGNLDFGMRELSQEDGESVVESYCWDMETNVRETRTFTIKHERHTKKGVSTLTDPRDIYEMTANYGARRLRSCILDILPEDLKERAEAKCLETVKQKGANIPIKDRVREMVAFFSSKGVDENLLEKRLGHSLDLVTEDELLDLRFIANGLRTGESKREDFFDLSSGGGGFAEEMNAEFNGGSKTTSKTKADVKK